MRIVLAAALLALVAGCGGSSDAGPQLPSCASVWVAGKVLPANYSGCALPSGYARTFDKAGSACTDGSFLVNYGEDYWANTGGRVHHATVVDDPAYSRAYMAC